MDEPCHLFHGMTNCPCHSGTGKGGGNDFSLSTWRTSVKLVPLDSYDNNLQGGSAEKSYLLWMFICNRIQREANLCKTSVNSSFILICLHWKWGPILNFVWKAKNHLPKLWSSHFPPCMVSPQARNIQASMFLSMYLFQGCVICLLIKRSLMQFTMN